MKIEWDLCDTGGIPIVKFPFVLYVILYLIFFNNQKVFELNMHTKIYHIVDISMSPLTVACVWNCMQIMIYSRLYVLTKIKRFEQLRRAWKILKYPYTIFFIFVLLLLMPPRVCLRTICSRVSLCWTELRKEVIRIAYIHLLKTIFFTLILVYWSKALSDTCVINVQSWLF